MIIKNLKIEKIIGHSLYKGDDNGTDLFKLKATNNLIDIDVDQKNQLETRIKDVFPKSIEMIEDEEKNESAYVNIIDLFEKHNDKEFVDKTIGIAEVLRKSQTTKNISDSIIIIIKGKIGIENSNDCIIILKADYDVSLQLVELEGKAVLKLIENTILGKEKKLYKVAVFEKNDNHLIINVYDSNIGMFNTRTMAIYFYSDFLGLNYKDNDISIAKDFYDVTKDFLKQQYIDKAELDNALYDLQSYMRSSNHATVDPDYYKNNILDQNKLEEYNLLLEEYPLFCNSVTKDLEYFRKYLKTKTLKFTNGIKVTVPMELYKQNVSISKEDQVIVLRIKGELDEWSNWFE